MEELHAIRKRRRSLQEVMNFMAALSAGIEPILGRGANSMTMSAGRKLGRQFSENAVKTDDLLTAIGEVRKVLEDNHCLWGFEPFKPKAQDALVTLNDKGEQQMYIVYRDCMIRQSLFRFGHPQKGSLCIMMTGFFDGALENIMGKKAKLDILHAGENGCLKLLTVAA